MKLRISILLLLLYSLKSHAYVEAYLVETSTLQFGNIIYVPGSCTLAYDTAQLTNLTAGNICTNSLGSVGGYRIFANPNTLVQITVKSHNDNGNGVIFVPEGDLVSDIETLTFNADISKTIDSGLSGVIDIRVGGRLTINTLLPSSTTFTEMFDIEFNEI